jgi:hypothetical protein
MRKISILATRDTTRSAKAVRALDRVVTTAYRNREGS